uniref:Uncharacterized protein LOC117360573 n=1 Tax=Geotrypetes seraphini TaxID=260995 RepID=A0A6P8QPQ0_GEOSA|nr:uncharacterized protein LOC117360573 [Geotrypetes seraphini]
MDAKQLAAVLDADRQQLTEDLRAEIRSNQEILRASQEAAQHRHEELVKAMSAQLRTLGLGGTASPQAPSGTNVQPAITQSLVGPNPLQFLTLCKMGPQDAADDFLNTFERVATAAGWPKSQWAVRLAPCLAGKALSAYQTLSPDQVTEYARVKDHILETLGFTREYYRRQFRGAHMLEGERPKALLQRLHRLAERWLQPCLADPQELLAEVLQEQFLEALPKNVQGWVRKQGGRTLTQVVEFTENYLDASSFNLGEDRGTRAPGRLGPNKEARDLMIPGIAPRTPQGEKRRPKGNLKCFRCGKVGHFHRNCWVRREF